MSEDLLALAENRYPYASDSPLTRMDPTGLLPCSYGVSLNYAFGPLFVQAGPVPLMCQVNVSGCVAGYKCHCDCPTEDRRAVCLEGSFGASCTLGDPGFLGAFIKIIERWRTSDPTGWVFGNLFRGVIGVNLPPPGGWMPGCVKRGLDFEEVCFDVCLVRTMISFCWSSGGSGNIQVQWGFCGFPSLGVHVGGRYCFADNRCGRAVPSMPPIGGAD